MVLKQAPLPGKAHGVFQFQELALHIQAIEITLKVSAFGDAAVARNDDGYRIVGIGLSYGAYRFEVAQFFSDGLISGGVAIGYLGQFLPNGLVESRGAAKIQLQAEFPPLPFEVFGELHHAFAQYRWNRPCRAGFFFHQLYRADSEAATLYLQAAERREEMGFLKHSNEPRLQFFRSPGQPGLYKFKLFREKLLEEFRA